MTGDAATVLVAVRDTRRISAGYPVDPADARCAAGHPPWRAAQFLAARTLLRRLLAVLEPDARHAEIDARPGGQPFLPRWPQLAISLTHDGELVGAAAGRCAGVGVDVQTVPVVADPGLLRRCLHRHARQLDPLGERARAELLAQVWTVQEACVKAAGTGLAGRPWTIDVPPGDRVGRWNGIRWVALHGRWPAPVAVAWRPLPVGDGTREVP